MGTRDHTRVADAPPGSLPEAVVAALLSGPLGGARSRKRIAALVARHGELVYPELLWALTHLRFDGRTARTHWEGVARRRLELSRRMGLEVDLRVALVHYFVHRTRAMKTPTLIELELLRQTQEAAYRDALTGLHNYRYLYEYLVQEIARVEQYGAALSVVLFDLDHFKSLNDRLGHETGNRALALVGKILGESVRKVDVAARYGGEEFVLVLSATTKDRALEIAERVRRRVENESGKGGLPRFTVSGGVATHPVDGLTPEAVTGAADQAMYEAKRAGRNQIVLFGGDRRSYGRVEAEIDGTFRAFSPHFRQFHCLDISEGGLLFRTERKLPMGALIDLTFQIGRTRFPVECVARVVRLIPKGRFTDTGVSFITMDGRSRARLVQFLRRRKRKA